MKFNLFKLIKENQGEWYNVYYYDLDSEGCINDVRQALVGNSILDSKAVKVWLPNSSEFSDEFISDLVIFQLKKRKWLKNNLHYKSFELSNFYFEAQEEYREFYIDKKGLPFLELRQIEKSELIKELENE